MHCLNYINIDIKFLIVSLNLKIFTNYKYIKKNLYFFNIENELLTLKMAISTNLSKLLATLYNLNAFSY